MWLRGLTWGPGEWEGSRCSLSWSGVQGSRGSLGGWRARAAADAWRGGLGPAVEALQSGWGAASLEEECQQWRLPAPQIQVSFCKSPTHSFGRCLGVSKRIVFMYSLVALPMAVFSPCP